MNFPDKVLATPYYFQWGVADADVLEKTGGFLYGGQDGERKEVLMTRDKYFAACKQKSGLHVSKQEKEKDAFLKHQRLVEQACKNGKIEIKYRYGIDQEMDITKGTKVHVSKIRNMMRDARKKGWTGKSIPGVDKAWTYYSSKGSMFAMHGEDGDSISWNGNLKGGTKQWICVLPEDKDKLDEVVRTILGANKKCADILRHKEFYFPTKFLDAIGVKWILVPQREGDIILTLPQCYHQGFSMECSINVAINMLCDWWIEYGLVANHVSENLVVL